MAILCYARNSEAHETGLSIFKQGAALYQKRLLQQQQQKTTCRTQLESNHSILVQEQCKLLVSSSSVTSSSGLNPLTLKCEYLINFDIIQCGTL